jgi:hypothetical protein
MGSGRFFACLDIEITETVLNYADLAGLTTWPAPAAFATRMGRGSSQGVFSRQFIAHVFYICKGTELISPQKSPAQGGEA